MENRQVGNATHQCPNFNEITTAELTRNTEHKPGHRIAYQGCRGERYDCTEQYTQDTEYLVLHLIVNGKKGDRHEKPDKNNQKYQKLALVWPTF
jgi:hypothetical protein